MRLRLHGPTMGTRWALTCDHAPGLDTQRLHADLQAAVDQIDARMSPWKSASDLVRLNRAPLDTWVDLPADMLHVLARALEISRLSAGCFDPALGDLVDAWGFGAVRDAPDAAAIRSARAAPRRLVHQIAPCPGFAWPPERVQDNLGASQRSLVGLELDRGGARVRKHTQLQLDLCGIAKGYAVDRMVAVLHRNGVRHALVALDGELRALGCQADGRPWPVALESPQIGRRAVHGVIELQDLAVATSGDYRRYVQVGDTRLAHSMDGRRAAPVHNDVASVSVLARSCMDADAWATALLVAGSTEGLALAQRMGLEGLFLLRRDGGLVEVGLGRFACAATA